MNRRILMFALLAALPMAGASAQKPLRLDWPNVNKPLDIAPGERVLLLNRIVVDRGPGLRPGGRIDYQIRTTIPPADVAAREAQAARVAQALADDARDAGVRMLSVAICDTEGCAGRHEPPRVWFIFERGANGVWQRLRQ